MIIRYDKKSPPIALNRQGFSKQILKTRAQKTHAQKNPYISTCLYFGTRERMTPQPIR
jgi:hypothetical protein